VGLLEGLVVGGAVGDVVGLTEGLVVGELVGNTVGLADGLAVGDAVGLCVGLVVGELVGETVGNKVGADVVGGTAVRVNHAPVLHPCVKLDESASATFSAAPSEISAYPIRQYHSCAPSTCDQYQLYFNHFPPP